MTAMCGQNIFSHVGGGLFLYTYLLRGHTAGAAVGKLLYSSHEIALDPILYAPIEQVMHKKL